MKKLNPKTIMNSPTLVCASVSEGQPLFQETHSGKLARVIWASLCLTWLWVPMTAFAQQTNVQGKLDLVEQAQKFTASDAHASGEFGSALAISGNTAVIGSGWDNSAYVFVLTNNTWSQQQKLTASDGMAGDRFGCSVAIDEDTIVAGAFLHNQGWGAAYVFVRSNNTWTEQQKLVQAPGSVQPPQFGISVGISGNTIIVGGPYYTLRNDSLAYGAAYVLVRTGNVWNHQKLLKPSNTREGDMFGWSVGVNGDTFAVGAPERSDLTTIPYTLYCGTAYKFVRSGSSWPQTELIRSDRATDDSFGATLALSSDTIVIGTRSGSAYVFSSSTGLQQQKLPIGQGWYDGLPVGVSGDAIIVGSPRDADRGENAGAAYLFVRKGTTWEQQRKFTASDGAVWDLFGTSVAVSGATMIIGASGDDDQGEATGSAYVFAPGYSNDTALANYVKKLLYFSSAAASPYFDPWSVAFLYKNRLYGTNGMGQLEAQFENISDYWPGVYLERSRAAEAELKLGLARNPASEVLGDLLLDIYYDRAVADALIARNVLAKADKVRYGHAGEGSIADPPLEGEFVIQNEIASYQEALLSNRVVLVNYSILFTGINESAIFQRLVPNRSLKPATFLVTNKVGNVTNYLEVPVTGDTQLFPGYKDLVLCNGLLRDYGRTAVTLARLHVARGDEAAATHLLSSTQRLLLLQSSLWAGLFPNLTLAPNDESGLAEAMAGVNNSLADLDALKQNLRGQVNPLGFANDFLMFVQSHGGEYVDTFNTIKDRLNEANAPNPLTIAYADLGAMESSYKTYRESQDQLAAQFAESSIAYVDRLRAIVGVFPDDPNYSKINPGSELQQQTNKIEIARNQILRNQTQMDNLVQQMQIEIDKTATITSIKVKYGEKEAALVERMAHISAAQAEITGFLDACSPEKIMSGEAIFSVIQGGVDATGEEMRGQLEAEKERLAAEEEAEITNAELDAKVKGIMLDMNVLLIDSQGAALTLQQEVNGLQALYREKRDLERKLVQRNNQLSRRYFADPIHRLSFHAGMIRANQSFEEAQRWLFFMARALEYKYNAPFTAGRWSSSAVFQLRNAAELRECYEAMSTFDFNIDPSTIWGAPDWDVFSLRKDAYRYMEGTNSQGQPLRYIVTMRDGSKSMPLDPTNAFRLYLQQKVTPNGELVLNFNTVHTVGNLFLGPTFENQALLHSGTYLDKIDEMKIRLALASNSSLGDGEVPQVTLTYGGTSYIRNQAVGTFDPERPDRLCNETTSYSTRFWQYVTSPAPAHWEAREALKAQGQKALRSRIPQNGEAMSIKPVIEFCDRSVAASDWTLTIPLSTGTSPNFNISELDDIEIYFKHRVATRPE